MTDSTDDQAARATGDAAWKQDRDAIAKRNADVKKRAQEKKSPGELALEARARRGAVAEAEQLKDLNKRISKGHPGTA